MVPRVSLNIGIRLSTMSMMGSRATDQKLAEMMSCSSPKPSESPLSSSLPSLNAATSTPIAAPAPMNMPGRGRANALNDPS